MRIDQIFTKLTPTVPRVNAELEGSGETELGFEEPTFELPGGLDQGTGLSAVFATDQIAVFHDLSRGYFDEIRSKNLTRPEPFEGLHSETGVSMPVGVGVDGITITLQTQELVMFRFGLRPGNAILERFTSDLNKPLEEPKPLSAFQGDLHSKLERCFKALFYPLDGF